MVEDELNKQKCPECSSIVRQNSLFCFHCGASVAPQIKKKDGMSDAWFKENIVIPDENAVKISEPKTEVIVKKTIAEESVTPTKTPEINAVESTDVAKSTTESKSEEITSQKLKSASAIRTKPKSVLRKSVEIVWEEPEGSSNIWFILAAILFSAIVAGLIAGAWYLR
jgi:hypothetical protein